MENFTVCLGSDFSLGPHQEEDIRVLLDGEWREDTVVSIHPDFNQPNIKVVGEVGEGGDHMFVSFRNLSDEPVKIKQHTKVVQLQRRNRGFSSVYEGGTKVTTEADDTAQDVHLHGGIHGVSMTGILVKKLGSKDGCGCNLSISFFRSLGQPGCGSACERKQGTTSYKLLDPFCGESLSPPASLRPQLLRRM